MSPQATSDPCRVRLISERECFLSRMKTLTGPRRRLLAHHAHLKIKRFPRKNTRAHTSLARPESQCLSFECTQFPLQTTSVVHSSASVSSVRGVLLLSSALSEAVQSLLWQSSKVKYDGERAELVLCWTRIWQRGELTMNWYESLAAQCFFFPLSYFLTSNGAIISFYTGVQKWGRVLWGGV